MTPRERRATRGILLMETLIALALLATGLLGALEAFWISSRTIRRSTDLSALAGCAQERLTGFILDRSLSAGACPEGFDWRPAPGAAAATAGWLATFRRGDDVLEERFDALAPTH